MRRPRRSDCGSVQKDSDRVCPKLDNPVAQQRHFCGPDQIVRSLHVPDFTRLESQDGAAAQGQDRGPWATISCDSRFCRNKRAVIRMAERSLGYR